MCNSNNETPLPAVIYINIYTQHSKPKQNTHIYYIIIYLYVFFFWLDFRESN